MLPRWVFWVAGLASVQGLAFENHEDKGQTPGRKFGHAGFKFRLWGLPWWSSGEESTFQGLPCWFSGKESMLPMQETWVWFLIREDLMCHGAAKRMCHSYWACALKPGNHNYWSPYACNKRSHCNEKPAHCNEEYPLLATTRESPCTAMKTQHSPKIK